MTISDVLEYVDDVKENEFTEAEKVQWINEIEGYVQIQIMLLAQPECKRYYASNTTEIAGIAFPTDSQMVLPKKIKAHKGGYISIEDLSDYSQNNKSDLEILGVSEDRRTLTFAEGTFVAGAEPESATAKIVFDCADTELLVPVPYEKLYYEYLLSKISENLEESREQNNRLATFRDTWENYAAWYATVYRPADGKAVFRGYYIKGDPGEPGRGEDGKDAYQIAVDEGFEGTVQEWLESLKGSDGEPGPEGPPGRDGIPDAPADGKQYARQNNAWAVVQGGSGQGWTTEQINLLEQLCFNLKYVDSQTGQAIAAQLINSLRGGEPSEYEITQNGDVLTIFKAPAVQSGSVLTIY